MELTRLIHGNLVYSRHVSLAAPATRCVVLAASRLHPHGGGEPFIDVELLPVVALRQTTSEIYTHPDGDFNPGLPSSLGRKEIQEDGWVLSHVEAGEVPIVVDPVCGAGLLAMPELVEDHGYLAVALAACTWPVEEDEDRLAHLVDHLKEEAVRIFERKASARAA